MIRFALLPPALFALGACTSTMGAIGRGGSEYLNPLPEPVAALAAPYQNLQAVKLMPEDGCYWYRHDGPVQTTMLPLRTPQGNPICTRRPDKPAPPPATG